MKNHSVRSSYSPTVLRLLSLMLALLFFSVPALAEEEDPVVVRVGDFYYTLSQVQKLLNSDLTLSRVLMAEYMDPEELAMQKAAPIARLVGICLIKEKLAEAGLIDFTSAEEEALKSAARAQYEDLWQQGWRYLQENSASPTEADVTNLLDSLGISVETVYEEYKLSELRTRAVSMYCPDIIMTEKQVREYYEEQFLIPDRVRYEDDIKTYEEEILATGSESFYTPAGYRRLRHILLDYPEEIQTPLRNDYYRLLQATESLSAAAQNLMMAAAEAESWDDIAEPRRIYDAALAEANEAQRVFEARRKELTEPLIAPRVEEIRSQYASGTPFLTLIDRYSTDTGTVNKGEGYPFHPDSTQWPAAFAEAASALEKPGDISEPVYTDLGIHILYYDSDIPSGDHVLTGEERQMLELAALRFYQDAALEELISVWRGEYDVEVHPELLND